MPSLVPTAAAASHFPVAVLRNPIAFKLLANQSLGKSFAFFGPPYCDGDDEDDNGARRFRRFHFAPCHCAGPALSAAGPVLVLVQGPFSAQESASRSPVDVWPQIDAQIFTTLCGLQSLPRFVNWVIFIPTRYLS